MKTYFSILGLAIGFSFGLLFTGNIGTAIALFALANLGFYLARYN